jgi:diguanylate cyclase (GGDEF)-like protein
MQKAYAEEECYVHTRETGEWRLSGIKRSPLSGMPTLILSYPVYSQHQKRWGVLLGELKIEMIEQLRRNVKFGINGHSAIVDQNGRVIAHPNPVWMEEMRDISHLSVVKLMMQGKTGVTTFYSPFIKQNMVAGYSAVPGYGWGIMVPQPEAEVAAQVRALMYSNFIWGLVGVVLAVILAVILARWINNPINRLAKASHKLLRNNLNGDMEESSETDPYEVRQLNSVVSSLVSHLQSSRKEVFELNNNLQVRIEEATQQLRDSNSQLEMFAKSDYLTSLANRRHFEEEMKSIAGRRRSDAEQICIMLVDIDNFKLINDNHGHAAGDKILTEIGRFLDSTMRAGDLVARYAGDEFVLVLHCAQDVAVQRAEQIRQAIENLSIDWEQDTIQTTVSIGVYCYENNGSVDIARIMQQVDDTMYKAKKAGGNRVASSD